MTKLKLLSAGLVAAAMIATPALAREGYAASRHVAVDRDDNAAPAARYVDGRVCYPAPRVGAFATQPWDNGNVPCLPEPGYY
jgi:hypothetical protein